MYFFLLKLNKFIKYLQAHQKQIHQIFTSSSSANKYVHSKEDAKLGLGKVSMAQ